MGVDVQENQDGTPEAGSRLCVCLASFLVTFATGGIPDSGSRHCSFVVLSLKEFVSADWASLVAQMVKNLPAMRETWV